MIEAAQNWEYIIDCKSTYKQKNITDSGQHENAVEDICVDSEIK